jgi:metal-responsive CopG/Arc/MetJ family transcriptional regulator
LRKSKQGPILHSNDTDNAQKRRVNLEIDSDLLDRVDAYASRVQRSRNAAIRYLLALGLREFEEAVRHEQAARSR